MASPQVSVLLPVYNARRYVAAAVESILAQTFADFELIVLDDGSTDGSQQILESLAAKDSRIRLIRHPNMGLLRTLNLGISQCRGEFIARMDADDIAMPNRFRAQVEFLSAHPEVAVLGTRVMLMDPEGVSIAADFFLTTHEEIDASHLAGQCALAHPSVMLRRTMFDVVGEYRGDRNEDMDLWLRARTHVRFANLAEIGLRYRVHASSKGHLEQGVSAEVGRLRWARLALHAGNYKSALILAAKGLRATPGVAVAWLTFGLAMAGPVGRRILKRRIR